jgi:hypothetical protein
MILNPVGKHVSVRTTDQELLECWNRVADHQVDDEEREKWHGVAMLMEENNKMDISNEPGHQFKGRIVEEYAAEVLSKIEQADAVATIGGEPANLAPRWATTRREAARA